MLSTTVKAVRAIIEADPTCTTRDRRTFLAMLRNGSVAMLPATPPGEPRLLRRAEAARRLGCSIRLVDRLARDGTLPKRRLPGRQRGAGILESDLVALLVAPVLAAAQTTEAA